MRQGRLLCSACSRAGARQRRHSANRAQGPFAMDNPQRGNDGHDGNDGPGRPPRKAVGEAPAEDDNVVEAFGDRQDVPMLVFLLFAAMLAEFFDIYFGWHC